MFGILIILAVVGLLLWLINTYIPMDAKVKKILNVVAIIAVILWLLNIFGVFGYVKSVPVPHVSLPAIEMIA